MQLTIPETKYTEKFGKIKKETYEKEEIAKKGEKQNKIQ